MRAYKGTYPGAEDTLGDFKWPLPNGGPGKWVRMRKRFENEAISIATPADHLADDATPEPWEIELEKPEARGFHVRAARGRLIRHIETWTSEVAENFAVVCLERRGLGSLGGSIDLHGGGSPPADHQEKLKGLPVGSLVDPEAKARPPHPGPLLEGLLRVGSGVGECPGNKGA